MLRFRWSDGLMLFAFSESTRTPSWSSPMAATSRRRCVVVYLVRIKSCHTKVYHGLPWSTMVYHGLPWSTMVYHIKSVCQDDRDLREERQRWVFENAPWKRLIVASPGIWKSTFVDQQWQLVLKQLCQLGIHATWTSALASCSSMTWWHDRRIWPIISTVHYSTWYIDVTNYTI